MEKKLEFTTLEKEQIIDIAKRLKDTIVPYPFVVVCLQPTHSAKGNIRFSVSVFSSFFSMKEELPQSRRLVCVPSL